MLHNEMKRTKWRCSRTSSISENLANKSSGIDQSKTSKFALILPSLVLLGSTLLPI